MKTGVRGVLGMTPAYGPSLIDCPASESYPHSPDNPFAYTACRTSGSLT